MAFCRSMTALAVGFILMNLGFVPTATAQTFELPDKFNKCAVFNEIPFDDGDSFNYHRCGDQSTVQTYGSVFVQFRPPANIAPPPPQSGKKKNSNARKFWNDLSKAAQKFFAPNKRSGIILLSLTLNQNGKKAPLDLLPLATFTLDETNGLSISNEAFTGVSNKVGYRFQATSDTVVETKFYVSYENSTDGKIVSSINDARELALKFGYVPAASLGGILEGLSKLEKELFSQADLKRRSARLTPLSFGTSGFSAVGHDFVLVPGQSPGSLFVGLERELSAFEMPRAAPELKGSAIAFNLASFDINHIGPIRTGLINQEPLTAHLDKMGFSASNLSTSDPAEFQIECTNLKRNLEKSSLGLLSQDQLLGMWAFLADNQNMTAQDIRNRPCIKTQETAFREMGLPLPEVQAPLPLNVLLMLEEVNRHIENAYIADQNAQDIRIKARNIANIAKLDSSDAGTERIVCWKLDASVDDQTPSNCAGTFDYAGERRDVVKRFLGTQVSTSKDTLKDEYSGQFRLDAEQRFVHEGLGVYRFGSNSNGAGRREYSGELVTHKFSGYGHMSWLDGRVYYGQFADGLPNGKGSMIFSDGTEQKGNFSDGHLRGLAWERKPDGTVTHGQFSGGKFVPRGFFVPTQPLTSGQAGISSP